MLRVLAVLLIAAGICCSVGSLARGYMVASGTVEPGEEIYPGEIAPALRDDYVAGAEGLVMLALGGWLFAKSRRNSK